MTEALLINQCRKNNGKAQRMLFDFYADTMFLVCIRYLKDVQRAEDAMIASFEKFFRNINKFEYRGDGSIGAFLKKIVVNECLMILRQAQRIITLDEVDMDEIAPSVDIISNLSAKEIFKLISELPDGYRTVFNLFEVEQFTHEQIAGELGITVGTSKSQLSKAKALLRKRLKQSSCDYANR